MIDIPQPEPDAVVEEGQDRVADVDQRLQDVGHYGGDYWRHVWAP
jgi:hypothetical protein